MTLIYVASTDPSRFIAATSCVEFKVIVCATRTGYRNGVFFGTGDCHGRSARGSGNVRDSDEIWSTKLGVGVVDDVA